MIDLMRNDMKMSYNKKQGQTRILLMYKTKNQNFVIFFTSF